MLEEGLDDGIPQPTIGIRSRAVCNLHCVDKVIRVGMVMKTGLELLLGQPTKSVDLILVGESVHCGMDCEWIDDFDNALRFLNNTVVFWFILRLSIMDRLGCILRVGRETGALIGACKATEARRFAVSRMIGLSNRSNRFNLFDTAQEQNPVLVAWIIIAKIEV